MKMLMQTNLSYETKVMHVVQNKTLLLSKNKKPGSIFFVFHLDSIQLLDKNN